ncbi:Estrogen-related receptor gamma [Manis javanica]|nr:Estrogen-related receptor gamma [Manis javanica]
MLACFIRSRKKKDPSNRTTIKAQLMGEFLLYLINGRTPVYSSHPWISCLGLFFHLEFHSQVLCRFSKWDRLVRSRTSQMLIFTASSPAVDSISRNHFLCSPSPLQAHIFCWPPSTGILKIQFYEHSMDYHAAVRL